MKIIGTYKDGGDPINKVTHMDRPYGQVQLCECVHGAVFKEEKSLNYPVTGPLVVAVLLSR